MSFENKTPLPPVRGDGGYRGESWIKTSGEVAIRVQNLSKCYQIYDQPPDRLKQSLYPRLQRLTGRPPKQYFREFWALKNISFDIEKGEAVGIIGRNGSGKSTLLQLICGTLNPTGGELETYGRMAALLELGSAFNPEFTGRENVYLNASILGLAQKEIDDKFDEIAAFADITGFLEQPVKTYSSGMLMRLAFAVSTSISPEILIVDEVLGVGDAPFQSKCFKRLRQLISDGTSVLFVSHDISTVRGMCTRTLWLKNGHAEMWGEAKTVAREYERFCWQEQGIVLSHPESSDESAPSALSISKTVSEKAGHDDQSIPLEVFQPNLVFDSNRERSRIGTGDVIIRNFVILNEAGFQATSCEYDDKLRLYYLLEVCRPVNSDFILGIRLRDLKGNFVYSANDIHSIHRIDAVSGERYLISTALRMPLAHQDYVVLTGVFGFRNGTAYANGAYDFSRSIIWDVIEDGAFLKVEPFKGMPLAGPVHASLDLKITKLN
jgi:lipopolysaccharide transport system ATP-binding protein